MYDDLLGKREPDKSEPESPPKKKKKSSGVAKWNIDSYESQPYCYQCGGTHFTVLKDKISAKRGIIKKMQCDTCFAEWNEVWDQNGKLVSIGFKF